MRTLRSGWLIAVLMPVAVLVCAACGTSGNAVTNESSPDEASATQPSDQGEGRQATSEEVSDLEALYWARQDSARMDFTEADVRFMTGMIKHHAQAVVMSRMAPTHGASPQVQTLAARIINAQQDEIATMQRWLRRRDQPVPQVEMPGGTRLTVDGRSVHGMPMRGVLTEAQIQALDDARGLTFDRLFLTYMIEHHSGAVSMVDNLFNMDGAAQDGESFKLASDIHVDQETEVARMRRMLDALPNAASGNTAP